jgi:hypothetical protein
MAAYLSPIGVVGDKGARFLAVNGFDNEPLKRAVLLFEMKEGGWEPTGDPIKVDLELESPGPIGSSLVRGPDGGWLLYGWGSPVGQPNSSIIWLAQAPELTGPWTVEEEPVLAKGSAGQWDDEGVLFPSVAVNNDGFSMLYDGFGSLDGDQVGLANSTDGINWVKFNDPATADGFEDSDPVFGPDPEGGFDSRSVQVGRLVATPSAWLMVYMGVPPGSGPSQVGVATSTDAVVWERLGVGLAAEDVPVPNLGLHTVDLTYANGILELFVEVLTDTNSTVWRSTMLLNAIG